MSSKPEIIVYSGPMFAGKSTNLINYYLNSGLPESEKAVFKYAKDIRYSTNSEIVTHNKETISCIMINSCADIINHINNNLSGKTIKEIYIDECQFLPDIYKWIMDIKEQQTVADSNLQTIILAGLDLDAKGNYFTDAFKNVIDIADVNYALQAFCYVCGANASYTKLLDTDTKMDGNVLIGGAELYQPVCGLHFCSSDDSN